MDRAGEIGGREGLDGGRTSLGSPLQALKRALVRAVGRERANRLSAPYHDWAARRRSLRTLRELPAKDLCLNVGCGPNALPGWVNIDMARAPGVDVVWDLRNGLPFADESCAVVFGEHVVEHMPKEAAEFLAREARRVLQTGGVLRLSTPDAGRYLRSYAGDREFLRHPSFGRPAETALERVNQMMREDGQHLWAYDAESLLLLLRKAGFSSAVEQRFGESLHARLRGVDSEGRAFESLYVEAVK
ncbi:MAG TPA: methyltransferase domain-containing protein [Pyrinomonadaceae bacterium]|nr:methyltransferase domain-containing protein [Pyrinomonadaceae bacterium]